MVIQHKHYGKNTTHCTTVQFLHQYCGALGWAILMLRSLVKISCCGLYTSMTAYQIYSVLSSENKAVYGMVDKSCHNHSGLLLYVALKREEEIILL